jgi:hypothetical protein
MTKPLQAFRREINRLCYLQLINRYVASYEGTLQPLSLSELAGLQSFGENAKAWQLLHGHWRCAQLQSHAAWNTQIRQNLALLQRLVAELQRSGPQFSFKGHLLRKLTRLQRYYWWQLANRRRRLRRETFLRESGLGYTSTGCTARG